MKVGTTGPLKLSVCEAGLCGTMANAAVLGPTEIDTICDSLDVVCEGTSVDIVSGWSGMLVDTV